MDYRAIRPVSIAELGELWPQCLPHLTEAMEIGGNDYTASDVLAMCLLGKAQVWVNLGETVRFCVVFKIDSWTQGVGTLPDKRVAVVILGGGDGLVDAFGQCTDDMTDWARANHCAELRIHGRMGWRKLARPGDRLSVSFSRAI